MIIVHKEKQKKKQKSTKNNILLKWSFRIDNMGVFLK